MNAPKPKPETATDKAARLAEEERIKIMQMRADADESAAGRRLLTKKTRAVVRLFGARRALAGGGGPGVAPGVPGGGLGGDGVGGGFGGGGVDFGGGGGSGNYPLGYEGAFGGGGLSGRKLPV